MIKAHNTICLYSCQTTIIRRTFIRFLVFLRIECVIIPLIMNKKSSSNTKILIGSILAILVITALSYIPSLGNGFVNWDDGKYILGNSLVQDWSPAGIRRMFTQIFIGLHHYHPLTLLSFAFDYNYFGENPAVFHINSLIGHLFNTAIVFWLFYKLVRNIQVAFIVSILFGIHPMHVESVAWISERKDIMYAFFYLLALVQYVNYCQLNYQRKYLNRCLLLFVLSLLSKPMAVTLPLALLCFDYYFHRKWNWPIVKEKILFFVLSLSFGSVFE